VSHLEGNDGNGSHTCTNCSDRPSAGTGTGDQVLAELANPESPAFGGAIALIAVLASLVICLGCCYIRYKRYQATQTNIRKMTKFPGAAAKCSASAFSSSYAAPNTEEMEARKKQLSTLLQQRMQAHALAACLGLADYEPSNVAVKDWTGLSAQVQKCGLPDRILSAFGSMALKAAKDSVRTRDDAYWDQPVFKVVSSSGAGKVTHGTAKAAADKMVMTANPIQARNSTRVVIPLDGPPPAVPIEASYCIADVPRHALLHVAVVCAQVSNVLLLLAACAARSNTHANTSISEHNGFDHLVNSVEGAVNAMAAVVRSAASDADSNTIFAAIPAAVDTVCADMMVHWLDNQMLSSMSISQRRNLLQQILRNGNLWSPSCEALRQCTMQALDTRSAWSVSFGGYMAIQVRGAPAKRVPLSTKEGKSASANFESQGALLLQQNPMARKGI
jgi:hypothetical protein